MSKQEASAGNAPIARSKLALDHVISPWLTSRSLGSPGAPQNTGRSVAQLRDADRQGERGGIKLPSVKKRRRSVFDCFQEIVAADFEFCGGDGDRPNPVCYVAHELRSGRKHRV